MMRMNTKILGFTISLALLFLTACATAPGGPGDGSIEDPEGLPRTPSGEVDIDAIKEADDVSQCVKTSLGLCGCNEGGEEVAVNKKYVDLLEEEYSTDESVACPQVYQCTDAEPTLENGSCTLNT